MVKINVTGWDKEANPIVSETIEQQDDRLAWLVAFATGKGMIDRGAVTLSYEVI